MGGGPEEARESPRYLSYLVRLWQVDTAGEGTRMGRTVWRGSLEGSLTGERLGFASLDELFQFLRRETDAVADVDERQKERS